MTKLASPEQVCMLKRSLPDPNADIRPRKLLHHSPVQQCASFWAHMMYEGSTHYLDWDPLATPRLRSTPFWSKICFSMPSHLLSVPREIRNLIIDHVIPSGRDAPHDHKAISGGARSSHHLLEYIKSVRLHGIMFETNLPKPSAYGLLLTNHQCHDEVVEALSRTKKEDQIYSVDIVFLEERELWPLGQEFQ
jgi:hypothetical protein